MTYNTRVLNKNRKLPDRETATTNIAQYEMIMSVQYFQPSPDQLSKSYKLLGYKMSSVYLALITLAVKYNSDFLFPLFI